MIVVKIMLCRWCCKPRYESRGTGGLKPGTYETKVEVSEETCIPCGTRFSSGIGKGGVSQSGTSEGDNATEAKKGS